MLFRRHRIDLIFLFPFRSKRLWHLVGTWWEEVCHLLLFSHGLVQHTPTLTLDQPSLVSLTRSSAFHSDPKFPSHGFRNGDPAKIAPQTAVRKTTGKSKGADGEEREIEGVVYKASSLSDLYPSTSSALTESCSLLVRSPIQVSLWPSRSPKRAKISTFQRDVVCQSPGSTRAHPLSSRLTTALLGVAESRLQTPGRSIGQFLARRPLIAAPAKLTSHPAPVDQDEEGHRARPSHPPSTDYDSAVDRNGAVGCSEGGRCAHRNQSRGGANTQRDAHSCPFLTCLFHPDTRRILNWRRMSSST